MFIPTKSVEPADYSVPSKPKEDLTKCKDSEITSKMADYFFHFHSKNQTGHISNTHEVVCDKFGPNDERAKKLAILFSRAVDAAKSGEPVQLPQGLTRKD